MNKRISTHLPNKMADRDFHRLIRINTDKRRKSFRIKKTEIKTRESTEEKKRGRNLMGLV